MNIYSKEQALEAAFISMPELQSRIIYKITDIEPFGTNKKSSDKWYIYYSSAEKHCAANYSSRIIAVSRKTGEVFPFVELF